MAHAVVWTTAVATALLGSVVSGQPTATKTARPMAALMRNSLPAATVARGQTSAATGTTSPQETVMWAPSAEHPNGFPIVKLDVNQTLDFFYTNEGSATPNVARVKTVEELNKCNLAQAITMNGQKGPYRLQFQSPGIFYFTSTVDSHCNQGLKVTVDVGKPASSGPASLEGAVYNDWNKNSEADPGEGLPDVPVTITQNNAPITTVTTGADGNWRAADLPAGTYVVSIGKIPGFNIPDSPSMHRSLTVYNGDVGKFDFRVLGPAPDRDATINGTLFNDKNDNERPDSGEGIRDAAIHLKKNGAVVASTTSSADGRYSFTVAPGEYELSIETMPGITVVKLPVTKKLGTTGGSVTQFNYRVVPPSPNAKAEIEGVIHHDKNENGKVDPGEGIRGATVIISDANGNVVTTTNTDSTGKYSVVVAPGTYQVDIEHIPGVPLPASEGKGKMIEAGPHTINVYNYSVVGNPAEDTVGTINGKIYWDKNDNGEFDKNEGVEGADVTLLNEDTGDNVGRVVTNADGSFFFTNLQPSNYRVQVGGLTGMNVDSNGLTSQVPIGNGKSMTANVEFRLTGEQQAEVEPFGYINGTVYNDNNGNSRSDVGEGIPGISVVAKDASSGKVIDSTTTSATGIYRLTLAPGDYDVVIGELPKASATEEERTRRITVAGGVTIPFNFRIVGQADPNADGALQGAIFMDSNNNGVADDDEGISGVTVDVKSGTQQVAKAVTGASGSFSITLPPGFYTVELGEFPGMDVPVEYRVRDIDILAGQTASFNFRVTEMSNA